jgi:hypothetical protein
VQLVRSRSPRNFHDIGPADSRAWNDDYPISRRRDDFRENGGTLESAFRATRSEYPSRTGLDHILKRLPQIRSFVKRAVIRHRQRPRNFNEFLRSLEINAPAISQYPQNDSIHTGFSRINNGVLHLRELRIRIDEVSRAWPDHHKYG